MLHSGMRLLDRSSGKSYRLTSMSILPVAEQIGLRIMARYNVFERNFDGNEPDRIEGPGSTAE